MLLRIMITLVVWTALFIQPFHVGVSGSGIAKAESQTINFTGNSIKETTVPPGKTDITPTCQGMNVNQYNQAEGWSFGFKCKSPVTDVTCHPGDPDDHCECNNGSNKSHTVKVAVQYCGNPPQ